MALACDLAAEHGSTVTALCVIEVQAELPLGADMREDEIAARRLLSNAQAIGDLYGIDVTVSTVRARAAGPAIVELAGDAGAEIVVLGPRRKPRVGRRAFAFGQTVAYVLAHAPCRVMLVAGPQGR